MRVAILESILMPVGHEVEYDRIVVEELNKEGHTPIFFVPENFKFKLNYNAGVEYLDGGEVVSYAGVSRWKRLYLSAIREWRRIKWYDSAAKKAAEGKCDAILIPTCSWRAMRSVRNSNIKNCSVPVLLVLHGIMPQDRARFISAVKSVKGYKNIHVGVLGLQTDFPELKDCSNFHLITAPVYKPFDIPFESKWEPHKPLRLGFYGQYRKEKNLEFFLEAFCKANFEEPVELLVQGATPTPEDSEDFERLAKKYAFNNNIKFLHKNLLGVEWQETLNYSDAILLPYGAERYRYQPSAMLFTAIGYYKPVLQSAKMNPEILAEFNIGQAVNLDSTDTFARQLESFCADLINKKEVYQKELQAANEKYSHANLIKSMMVTWAK